jgi:hypothetical protein
LHVQAWKLLLWMFLLSSFLRSLYINTPQGNYVSCIHTSYNYFGFVGNSTYVECHTQITPSHTAFHELWIEQLVKKLYAFTLLQVKACHWTPWAVLLLAFNECVPKMHHYIICAHTELLSTETLDHWDVSESATVTVEAVLCMLNAFSGKWMMQRF